MDLPAAQPLRTVGDHLRAWRKHRRLSQLAFALDAEISQKHLSFIESGRAVPSRQMVLRLADCLNVPLKDRNHMMLAAGYAPVYPEHALDDPVMDAARRAVDLVLKGHEPFPAIAVDRHWTLVAANAAVPPLLSLVRDRMLLKPPVNVMRLSLAPGGLAPAIINLSEWRTHLLARLRQQIDITADIRLEALRRELVTYPSPESAAPCLPDANARSVVVPLMLQTPVGVLSFISTTTVFGTPVDITLSELALEAFYPADDSTRELVRELMLPGRA